MKYMGMPVALWAVFTRSFRKNLETCFGLNATEAKEVTRKAKVRYKKIIRELPEFEKEDRFKMNIVSCAMIGAFVLSMPKRPDVKTLTNYYRDSSMTPLVSWFFRQSGKLKFSEKDRQMQKTARLQKPPTAILFPGIWTTSNILTAAATRPFLQVRHLRPHEKTRPLRPDSRPLPPGL